MEDVLDVYTRPFDPKRPLVCLDEGRKQLLSQSRPPLPMEPGQPLREDYEYGREGTCSCFLCLAPLLSWRHVEVDGAAHRPRLRPRRQRPGGRAVSRC